MDKPINFTPGPAMLPPEVEKYLRLATRDFLGTGLPVWSVSHRSPKFHDVVDETIELVRRLLGVPAAFTILFTAGGATSQFKGVVLNLIEPHRTPTVGYLLSGHWSRQAFLAGQQLQAGGLCHAEILASTEADKFRSMPELASGGDHHRVHYCPNETSNGTQMGRLPPRNGANVITMADMSSEIAMRTLDPLDWGHLDLVYAGTQKNLGAPGTLTLVIVRTSLLDATVEHPALPAPLSYREQLKHRGALRNTVDTLALYSVYLTLKWIKKEGGLPRMEAQAAARSTLLYRAIDESPIFEGMAYANHRSRVNVTFRVKQEFGEDVFVGFLEACEAAGLIGLKGHAGVNEHYGPHFRASLYNAMPVEGVYRLTEAMQAFERRL